MGGEVGVVGGAEEGLVEDVVGGKGNRGWRKGVSKGEGRERKGEGRDNIG